MKSLLTLAAIAALAPAFIACGNKSQQQEAVDQDEKVMEQLGDKGNAEIVEPATEGITAAGDTVVAIIDAVDIK